MELWTSGKNYAELHANLRGVMNLYQVSFFCHPIHVKLFMFPGFRTISWKINLGV